MEARAAEERNRTKCKSEIEQGKPGKSSVFVRVVHPAWGVVSLVLLFSPAALAKNWRALAHYLFQLLINIWPSPRDSSAKNDPIRSIVNIALAARLLWLTLAEV